MNRDPRYSVIRSMYEKGNIQSFTDIFIYSNKTVVAKDMGMRVDKFNKFLNKIEAFTLEHIDRIAFLCDMDLDVMIQLWRKEYRKQKEVRKLNMTESSFIKK